MNKNYFICFTLLIVLITGCKKDLQSVVTLSEPIQNDNVIVLNWKVDNLSGFKYYRILRAIDKQHYTTINNIDSLASDAFNKNITSFSDSNFPFVDSIYYKIQVFGDEIISSRNVCIHINKPFSFDQPISGAYFLPETKKALIFTGMGYSTPKMNLFNLSTGLIENKVDILVETTGSQIGYGQFKGNYEFYFYDSWNNKITIYDAQNMTPVGSLSMAIDYPKILSDKNGNVFLFSAYSNYITIINREKLVKSNFYTSNNFLAIKYNTEKNTIIAAGNSQFVEYQLDPSGNITSLTTKSIPNVSFNQFVENSDFIYRGNPGSRKIVHTITWQEFALNDENNSYVEFSLLYSKNNVLYASKGTKIYCYSMNDFKLLKILSIRFLPEAFLSDDQFLYFYGNYSTLNFLDKISLLK